MTVDGIRKNQMVFHKNNMYIGGKEHEKNDVGVHGSSHGVSPWLPAAANRRQQRPPGRLHRRSPRRRNRKMPGTARWKSHGGMQ